MQLINIGDLPGVLVQPTSDWQEIEEGIELICGAGYEHQTAILGHIHYERCTGDG